MKIQYFIENKKTMFAPKNCTKLKDSCQPAICWTDNGIKCFNMTWWHALKVAGISDLHFHDLRHTFCSKLIMSGGGLKDAKEMIGHSDISMTDRYAHLSGDHVIRKQDQLAEHYLEGLSN
jgi:site-specific recombinase XerD